MTGIESGEKQPDGGRKAVATSTDPVRPSPPPAPAKTKGGDPKPKPIPAPAAPDAPPPPDTTAEFEAAFLAAYRALCDKLQAIWNPVDLQQTAAEADHTLQRRLAALEGPDQALERCEAWAEYFRAIRRVTAPERQRAQIDFAMARYLDAVKVIWDRPDLHRIDPRVITAFGESIAWAGYHVGQRPHG